MERSGTATLPLHGGKCPRWLFSRMVRLAREVSLMVIHEKKEKGFLERVGNPYWFQALGCLLGFDWHSSGVTTTTVGALKEALNSLPEREATVLVAGGKGSTAINTPREIELLGERVELSRDMEDGLKNASRMSARVDNNTVQDGYDLYHHAIFFSLDGEWTVVQQGMNPSTRMARRYHWVGARVESFVREPHSGVCCDARSPTLDLTSEGNEGLREGATELAMDPVLLREGLEALENGGWKELEMPVEHGPIRLSERSKRVLERIAREEPPESFEALVAKRGVGRSGLRALALASCLVYGERVDWSDPAVYSFAHGGKDGVPYRVKKKLMEETTSVLGDAVRNARLGRKEKTAALKRLYEWTSRMADKNQ